MCQVYDRGITHLSLLDQWVGRYGEVAKTDVADDVAPREVSDRLPNVFIRPVAVTLDKIDRGPVWGRAVVSDASYSKFRGGVSVLVHFGRYYLE